MHVLQSTPTSSEHGLDRQLVHAVYLSHIR